MWKTKKRKIWFWKPKPNIIYKYKSKEHWSHPNRAGYHFIKKNKVKIIDSDGAEYDGTFMIDENRMCKIRIYDIEKNFKRYLKEERSIPVKNLKFSKHFIVETYWGQGGGRHKTWLYTVKIKVI